MDMVSFTDGENFDSRKKVFLQAMVTIQYNKKTHQDQFSVFDPALEAKWKTQ